MSKVALLIRYPVCLALQVALSGGEAKGVAMNNGRTNRGTVDVEALGDRALNYYPDQLPDIKPRLRKLNLQRGLGTAGEMARTSASAALLGGAAVALLRGRFVAASFFAAGLFLQQALSKRIKRGAMLNVRGRRGTEREDLEIERYALKAQRGDYGKLEVIPFK